jgi:signal transduction histidine kinase
MIKRKFRTQSIFFRLLMVMLVMALVVVFLFVVVYLLASREIFQLSMAAHYFLIIFLFGLLIFALFSTYHVLKKYITPLKGLTKAALEVSNGNFNVEVPVEGTDELGELSLTFNTMAGEIQEMIDARERMLRDVSHEFKTPLTRLKLAIEMLEDRSVRESMAEDVQELEELVNEILDAEKLRKGIITGTFQKADIITTIRKVVSSFEGSHPEIVLKEMPVFFELYFEEKAVKKALKNLIQNALKFSRPDSKPVEVTAQQEGGRFVIKIKDDGIGISEEALSLVFKPFYQVEESRTKAPGKSGGYGLGLSLVKKVMEAHGGEVKLKNAPEGGIVATLHFPA